MNDTVSPSKETSMTIHHQKKKKIIAAISFVPCTSHKQVCKEWKNVKDSERNSVSGFTFYWKFLKSVLSSFTMLLDIQYFLQLQCTANGVIFKSPFSTLFWPMRVRYKYIYLGVKYCKLYQIVISSAHTSRIIFLRPHQIKFQTSGSGPFWILSCTVVY